MELMGRRHFFEVSPCPVLSKAISSLATRSLQNTLFNYFFLFSEYLLKFGFLVLRYLLEFFLTLSQCRNSVKYKLSR